MFLHGLWLKCHFASDSKLRRKSEIATISRISFQCFQEEQGALQFWKVSEQLLSTPNTFSLIIVIFLEAIFYLPFLFMHVCTRSPGFRARLQCLLRSTKLLSVYTCIIIAPFLLHFICNTFSQVLYHKFYFSMFFFHGKIKVSIGQLCACCLWPYFYHLK